MIYYDGLDVEFFVDSESKENIKKLINELVFNIDWYKMWHKDFQNQIEKLTTQLETYRPTKLNGEGQTTCHKCKVINWTCFGFYRYKGQILCDKCLKEILLKESIGNDKDKK